MLRFLVMKLHNLSQLEPNKIIIIFIVFGSLIFFEVACFFFKFIIRGKKKSKNGKFVEDTVGEENER